MSIGGINEIYGNAPRRFYGVDVGAAARRRYAGGGTSGLSQFVGNMKRHLPSMPWRKQQPAATAVAQPVPAGASVGVVQPQPDLIKRIDEFKDTLLKNTNPDESANFKNIKVQIPNKLVSLHKVSENQFIERRKTQSSGETSTEHLKPAQGVVTHQPTATAVAQPVPAPVIHDATDKVIMTPNMCKKPFSDTRTKELCTICRNEILRMEQRETIGSKFLSSIIENSAAITAFTSLLTKCQTDPESYKTHVSQETQLRKLVQNDAGSGGVQAEEYIVHFVTKLTQLNCTVPTTP